MLEVECVHLNTYGMPKQKTGVVLSMYEGTNVNWSTVMSAALREGLHASKRSSGPLSNSILQYHFPHARCLLWRLGWADAVSRRSQPRIGGGQQRPPRGLASQTTLPFPASGSVIRAHSSADTHPKGQRTQPGQS